jgi:hypothetical protein
MGNIGGIGDLGIGDWGLGDWGLGDWAGLRARGAKTAVDLGWVGLVVSAPVSSIEQGLVLVGVVVVVSD